MIIYQYDSNGFYTSVSREVDAKAPIPKGWTHKEPVEGARFVGNLWQNVPVEPPPPEPVPESVTARQARQWMIENSILPSQVDALIADIEDATERELLKNYWEYSTLYQRNHPLLIALGERLNLTPEQLDQAFREASTL